MSRGRAERIELALDIGASALVGAAVAYGVVRLASPSLSAATAAFALGCTLATLRRVQPEDPGFELPAFVVRPPVFEETDELLLTEADRFIPAEAVEEQVLILEDILAKLGQESRVVRLFDPDAMPTPGQLKARIDRHLDDGNPPSSDASQELHEALAQLRQSLR